MTKRQRDAIIRVIKKDATISGLYIGETDGDACVLGGLALAAGVQRDTLEEVNTKSITDSVFRYAPDPNVASAAMRLLRGTLRKKYGLNLNQMHKLQFINDDSLSIEERRERLIEAVRKFRVK